VCSVGCSLPTGSTKLKLDHVTVCVDCRITSIKRTARKVNRMCICSSRRNGRCVSLGPRPRASSVTLLCRSIDHKTRANTPKRRKHNLPPKSRTGPQRDPERGLTLAQASANGRTRTGRQTDDQTHNQTSTPSPRSGWHTYQHCLVYNCIRRGSVTAPVHGHSKHDECRALFGFCLPYHR
jgi:hypothetical protein